MDLYDVDQLAFCPVSLDCQAEHAIHVKHLVLLQISGAGISRLSSKCTHRCPLETALHSEGGSATETLPCSSILCWTHLSCQSSRAWCFLCSRRQR